MNVSQLVLVAGLLIFAITAVTFGVVKLASAGSAGVCRAGCLHGVHWGGSGSEKQLGVMKQNCKEKSQEKFAKGIAHVADSLGLRESQTVQYQAWMELKTALEAEQNTVDYVCEKIFNPDSLVDAPARFELLESLMLTSVESLQRIRPLFDGFYATLDQEQKDTLEKFFQNHHRARHRLFH